MCTGQVEEVRFLVKLVKDSTGAVFDIGRGKDGDTVLRECFGEVCATVVIFESRNSGSHWIGEE